MVPEPADAAEAAAWSVELQEAVGVLLHEQPDIEVGSRPPAPPPPLEPAGHQLVHGFSVAERSLTVPLSPCLSPRRRWTPPPPGCRSVGHRSRPTPKR